MRAMSLAADEGEGEQMELRTLQEQLVLTQTLVINLSQQLNELKDQVRKNATISQMGIANSLNSHFADDGAEEAEAAHRPAQPQHLQHAQHGLQLERGPISYKKQQHNIRTRNDTKFSEYLECSRNKQRIQISDAKSI